MQFPIADCAAHPDCASCLGNNNPLCGWCVVENKCSRRRECQNSQDSGRWIQAVGSNTDQCPTIMVSPEQYVMDNPQTVNAEIVRSYAAINTIIFYYNIDYPDSVPYSPHAPGE